MTAAPQPAPTVGIALLERAIGYTRTSLAAVTELSLGRPTPCADWDLAELLEHMDDSLAALTEATAGLGVGLRPIAVPAAHDLPGRLQARACALLGAWLRADAVPAGGWVGVGDLPMPAELVLATGAVEIAVHGWDVAQACELTHPLPDALAVELLPYVPRLLDIADAQDLFDPAVVIDDGPGRQLLGALGRST